jgi:uncharacterized membrane protein
MSVDEHEGARDLPRTVESDVDAIAHLERASLERRSLAELLSDVIVGAVGSIPSVLLHFGIIAAWICVNLGLVAAIEPFDPFPFGVLTLLVSGEGVFLAVFILISQNRMSRTDEARSHLHLQVSALAERKATTMLQLLRAIEGHCGLDAGKKADSRGLEMETDLEGVARQIERKVP